MTARHTEGRGTCPGLRASECGSVTVEAAGALMAITVFFVMLVTGLGAFGTQIALTSLARDAARAASLASDRPSAEAAVERVLRNAEGVNHIVASDGEFIRVSLTRQVRLFRIPGGLQLSAAASALEESPW